MASGSRAKTRPGRAQRTCIYLLFIVLGGLGCSKPLLEGPQITRLPAGFMMDANASGASTILPDRTQQDQFGYFSLGADDEHSSIMITTFSGKTTYEEARAAYQAEQARRSRHRFGPLQTLIIDQQPAWGWLVTQHYKGEVSSLKFTAVISYEEKETTYITEFYASESRFHDEELLKETLMTFRVKEEKVSYGKVGMAVMLVVGFVGILTRLKKERA